MYSTPIHENPVFLTSGTRDQYPGTRVYPGTGPCSSVYDARLQPPSSEHHTTKTLSKAPGEMTVRNVLSGTGYGRPCTAFVKFAGKTRLRPNE
eukprot:1472364-Rhodomonas_salina.4